MTQNITNTEIPQSLEQNPSQATFDKTHLEVEMGVQPLDSIMTDLSLSNHDVVAASLELDTQLSHKAVAKARKGRRLTPKLMAKVTEAFNQAALNRIEEFTRKKREELFNY